MRPPPARRFLLAWLFATACGGDATAPEEAPAPPAVSPPFEGTIFIAPHLLSDEDPSTFVDLMDAGRGVRTMYDRRVADWISVEAILFDATYDDGLAIEVQVNPEFGSTGNARNRAAFYAEVIGRLPTSLRRDVETVWIHAGGELFGGGNNNLLIHVDQGDRYIADGILEETFIHEAAHTSLDADHAASPGWLAAQAADPTFISTYARDHPGREDIAESFITWLMVRHGGDRVPQAVRAEILTAIPNRLAYFDGLDLDLHPHW